MPLLDEPPPHGAPWLVVDTMQTQLVAQKAGLPPASRSKKGSTWMIEAPFRVAGEYNSRLRALRLLDVGRSSAVTR